MMTSAQFVKTSVNVTTNSPLRTHTSPIYDNSWVKPFTLLYLCFREGMEHQELQGSEEHEEQR